MPDLDTIYVYAAREKGGTEYQLCAHDDRHGFFPCMGTNEAKVKDLHQESMKKIAKDYPELEVSLFKFTREKIIETINEEAERANH